jgi:hypothetical protein
MNTLQSLHKLSQFKQTYIIFKKTCKIYLANKNYWDRQHAQSDKRSLFDDDLYMAF